MLRGDVRNKQYASQIRDFTGLRYGNITPTDLDGLIEFRNSCYVLLEAKYQNALMTDGQRIALERLCDDLGKIKPTMLILCTHSYTYPDKIDFARCVVEAYRVKGEWIYPPYFVQVKALVDRFLEMEGKK